MNEEKKKKRKEWVKTAAIVFLSVMLVLTFFSNTIMNYSLPEVATQYVQSGTITAKVRGSGTVESNDPYEVTIKETRKVASVAVKAGDTVQQGDVLLYLADQESDELEAAEKELETAQDAYDTAFLSADTNANVLANTGSGTSTTSYRQQINDAQAAVKAAQADVDAWQDKYDDYTAQIAVTPANDADTSDEQKAYDTAKTNLENANYALTEKKNALTAAQATVDSLESQIDYYSSISSGDASKLKTKLSEAQKTVLEAQNAVDSAQNTVNAKQLAFDKAETALNNKKTSGDTTGTVSDLTIQQASAKASLDAAQKVLDDKTEALTNLTANINQTLNLTTLYRAVTDAQEKVSELTAESIGATVTADIAGTVTSINATAGKEISAADTVAVIQPEGKGYTMSFSVTNDQAKKLSVGDVAELVNSWNYDDVTVTLASIKPDTTDPSQKKLLTFDVTGTGATAGQSLSVSVGQKSGTYDLVVPNSAIREDNNGKFILIVETKSTPLSNRYIATRVDVEVLASDDTSSAVSGALYGYEYVITTSTAPVEAGKQVRLANETS